LCPPSPRPLRKKRRKTVSIKIWFQIAPNCPEKLFKIVPKLSRKLKFSKSPEIAAAAARRNFGAEIPFLLKTTNKQTNNSRSREKKKL